MIIEKLLKEPWNLWVTFPFVLDRGKKLRVAPEGSDLSSQWLNMVANMMDKGKP